MHFDKKLTRERDATRTSRELRLAQKRREKVKTIWASKKTPALGYLLFIRRIR